MFLRTLLIAPLLAFSVFWFTCATEARADELADAISDTANSFAVSMIMAENCDDAEILRVIINNRGNLLEMFEAMVDFDFANKVDELINLRVEIARHKITRECDMEQSMLALQDFNETVNFLLKIVDLEE